MNKIQKKLLILGVILMLSMTLAGCGTVKSEAQGTWVLTEDHRMTMKIDGDDLTLYYGKESMKGKVREYKKDYATLEMAGPENNGKATFKNGKMYIGDLVYKKKD
ncbi:hypothetical protein [Mammaliicoccus sp. Dog046]|uniref:hypothetical protein n=1 Tax=Mammaliicoccus sp. Dog046 TaxID=3034233 RepID=UPI002B263FAF|nr:hypothetical protein [Mammaliicoccus sp. Dog046]WQK86189.1 hypothetical protein P3U32_03895 [Mammaliicoccus sp. Dog046]